MARKSSSQLSLAKIGVTLLVIAVVGGIFIMLTSSGEKRTVSGQNNFPIEEYMLFGSSLRDNEYVLYGKVENRLTDAGGDLITLVIKRDGYGEERLPVIVPRDARTVNVEREQNYRFVVKVENKGDSKGLIVAKEITQ